MNITEVRNLFAYFEILPNLVIPLYVFNIEISLFKSFDWNIIGKFYRIAVFLSNVVKIWLFIYLFWLEHGYLRNDNVVKLLFD